MVRSMPSVAAALRHKELDALVMVRQFRPAVFATTARDRELRGLPPPPVEAGLTYELPAGLLDKPGLSRADVARAEVGVNPPGRSI